MMLSKCASLLTDTKEALEAKAKPPDAEEEEALLAALFAEDIE